MARDVVLLHGFTHTGASWDPVVAALGGTLPGARARHPRARRRRRERASRSRSTAVLDDVRRARAGAVHARRLLDGRPDRAARRARARAPARVERLVLIGASPGIADPAERAARRAADERLADEIEQHDHRGVRASLGADARARGTAAGGGRGRRRRPAAKSAGGAGARAARPRHRRAAVAVGPPRRARRAGDAGGRASATRSSRRSPTRWRAGYRMQALLQSPARVTPSISRRRSASRSRSPTGPDVTEEGRATTQPGG